MEVTLRLIPAMAVCLLVFVAFANAALAREVCWKVGTDGKVTCHEVKGVQEWQKPVPPVAKATGRKCNAIGTRYRCVQPNGAEGWCYCK